MKQSVAAGAQELFHDTEAGSFAGLAKEQLEGAFVLDRAQRKCGKILFRPTLFLAGQGLELMLKGCMVWNGQPIKRSGGDGHKIIPMWDADACELIRGHMFGNASRIASQYRTSGRYPDAIAEDDVLSKIDEYVRALGSLHGGGGYPLRYPSDPGRIGPRTPFLVQTLWATADDFVKRPNDFKLDVFQGRA